MSDCNRVNLIMNVMLRITYVLTSDAAVSINHIFKFMDKTRKEICNYHENAANTLMHLFYVLCCLGGNSNLNKGIKFDEKRFCKNLNTWLVIKKSFTFCVTESKWFPYNLKSNWYIDIVGYLKFYTVSLFLSLCWLYPV